MFPDRSQQDGVANPLSRPVVRPSLSGITAAPVRPAPQPVDMAVNAAAQWQAQRAPQQPTALQPVAQAQAPLAVPRPLAAPITPTIPTPQISQIPQIPQTPQTSTASVITPVQPVRAAPSQPPQPAVQPHEQGEAELDRILSSFTPEAPPKRSGPDIAEVPHQSDSKEQPRKLAAKLLSGKNAVRAAAVAAVFGLVLFGGLGIYHGYTKDTPYVRAAVVKPVTPQQDTLAQTSANVGALSEQSGDSQRATTIKALHVQLEDFYAANGYYPSLHDMQDLGWIAKNFKDFDMTSLKDPAGSAAGLAAAPGAGKYAYQVGADVRMGSCDNAAMNCNYYVLTATLSNGKAYTATAMR